MTGLDLLAKTGSRGLFIGGQWRESGTGARFEVHDPADESVITDVADGDTQDAMAALDAAVAAQSGWASTPPRDRGEILRRSFEAIMDQADDFAELISLEMGKTLAEAKGEVVYGAEFFRWFAEEAVRIHGRWMQAPAGGSRLLTIRKPVGPCLFITPWNFPLAMGTRKIGPAVAAGCTMIAKMRNMGEACTAANRFLVHESVAREFADRLGQRMGALRTGRGQTAGTDVGPLINADAVESVGRLVTDAVQDGAELVTGGHAPEGPGHFYSPTVLLGVPAEARIVNEEIFGPVAPITTFTSDDDAIALANATEYGLASYVYTRDLARTIKVAEALQFGLVGVT